jgi:hypothetical protein
VLFSLVFYCEIDAAKHQRHKHDCQHHVREKNHKVERLVPALARVAMRTTQNKSRDVANQENTGGCEGSNHALSVQKLATLGDGSPACYQEDKAARIEHGVERRMNFLPDHSALEHVASNRDETEGNGKDEPIDRLAKEIAILGLGNFGHELCNAVDDHDDEEHGQVDDGEEKESARPFGVAVAHADDGVEEVRATENGRGEEVQFPCNA